jgi:LEA14-like dessication related protein
LLAVAGMKQTSAMCGLALMAGTASAALSGCSMFMNSMERPQVAVRDVSLGSAGLGGVRGALRLDITNPNGVGVPLTGIDWQLAIGGARAVTGRVELSQTIPAHGVAPVTTSLEVSMIDAAFVASALSRGARDYALSATLHFSAGFGQLDIAVQHEGTLGAGLAGR